MLRNKVYAGYVERDGICNEEPSEKYPNLWDRDTWRAVQPELHRRKRGGKPPASVISGVAYCARCGIGLAVCGEYTDGDKRLRCATHAHSWVSTPTCHPNISKEGDVIDPIEALLARLRETRGWSINL